ncbi:chaperone protein DnaJ [Nitzschia inconspicua]|uniref:Chaperone protein DnaJ n=1 Tax=Nitzschia inconspicua TaxID=303405 RepID=A0A9K3PPQ7_9STRA|nr:chaperone protein DnaJ [Nitzschia inconspicua]
MKFPTLAVSVFFLYANHEVGGGSNLGVAAFAPTSYTTARKSGTASINHRVGGSSSAGSSSSSSSFSTALYMSTRNQTGRDFYRILGISRNASVAEIKQAYRKLAKEYHPDANPNKDTTEQFQDINRAYEVLKDPDLKRKYDMFGESGIGTSAASDSTAGSPFGGGGFGQDVDLNDIFDSFFGGGGMGGGMGGGFGGRGRAASRGPVVGNDLRFDLEIDFKTAVFGGEEKVRIRHLETCDTCTGTGVKPGSKISTCSTCGGSGVTVEVTRTPLGNFQTQQTCPTCRGTGQKIEEYCGTCGGQGLNQKTKQIKVTVPAGVEDGNKLRVRGEGDAGPNGGPAGDLYIFLRVKEDPNFRREGPEIYSEETISYLDAILGNSIKTPVVDGEVTIKVPPGTQPGQVMRLKGNGAPRLGNPNQRGDHYVTVKVEIPKDLSKEEEELIEKLKNLQEAKNGKAEGKKGGWFNKGE